MFSRVGTRFLRNSAIAVPRRALGGGPKKAATPYDLPKTHPYPDQAYPLGLVPGAKSEGWEGVTIVTLLACTIVIVFGTNAKDDDSFKSWCRREALAREAHTENGGEVEFGKYYQKVDFAPNDFNDAMPERAEE